MDLRLLCQLGQVPAHAGVIGVHMIIFMHTVVTNEHKIAYAILSSGAGTVCR